MKRKCSSQVKEDLLSYTFDQQESFEPYNRRKILTLTHSNLDMAIGYKSKTLERQNNNKIISSMNKRTITESSLPEPYHPDISHFKIRSIRHQYLDKKIVRIPKVTLGILSTQRKKATPTKIRQFKSKDRVKIVIQSCRLSQATKRFNNRRIAKKLG